VTGFRKFAVTIGSKQEKAKTQLSFSSYFSKATFSKYETKKSHSPVNRRTNGFKYIV
jgi:hypothetical protein